MFGRDAYGRVELSGGAMEMIVKSKGSAGTAEKDDGGARENEEQQKEVTTRKLQRNNNK